MKTVDIVTPEPEPEPEVNEQPEDDYEEGNEADETYLDEEEGYLKNSGDYCNDEDQLLDSIVEEQRSQQEPAAVVRKRIYFPKPSTDSNRRRSKVWNHFNVNKETKAAYCKVCNQKLSYNSNSTSNLLNHLKSIHAVTEDELGLNELPKRNPDGAPAKLKTSPVWDMFTVDSDAGKAICTLCLAEFKHNLRSTSNLLNHIRGRHPEMVLPATRDEEQEIEESILPRMITFSDPLNPRPKKRTSKIWEHFSINEETKTAVCNKCSKKLCFSRTTTSNLLKHLTSYCPAILDESLVEGGEDSEQVLEEMKVEKYDSD